MTFSPALAAAILAVRDDGARRVTRAISWLPIFGLMPLVTVVNWLWVVGAGRAPEVVGLPWPLGPVLSGMFLIGDLGKELGWQGYATTHWRPASARWRPPSAWARSGL